MNPIHAVIHLGCPNILLNSPILFQNIINLYPVYNVITVPVQLAACIHPCVAVCIIGHLLLPNTLYHRHSLNLRTFTTKTTHGRGKEKFVIVMSHLWLGHHRRWVHKWVHIKASTMQTINHPFYGWQVDLVVRQYDLGVCARWFGAIDHGYNPSWQVMWSLGSGWKQLSVTLHKVLLANP